MVMTLMKVILVYGPRSIAETLVKSRLFKLADSVPYYKKK